MDVFREKLRDGMVRSLSEIIESMAFMKAEPVEVLGLSSTLESVEERWATLLVHDPVQGEFRMQMSQQMLKNIAEAIYGPLPGGLSEQSLDDTLAEMTNTVVGHLLNHVLSEEQTYHLGLPELGHGACPSAEENDLVCDFSIEGELLRLAVSGESLLNL